MHKPTSQKFYPYVKDSKRLSLLASKITDFQGSLVATWKSISQASASNRAFVRTIKRDAELERPNEIFRFEYEKRKKKLKLQSPKSPSEVQKKIESILMSPRLSDKYPLARNNCKAISIESERPFIGFEDVRSPEAKEILSHNKRAFGEHFNEEIQLPAVERSKSKLENVAKVEHKPKKLKSKGGRGKGTVSQMQFPYVSKATLKEEEKELLFNILKEKANSKSRFNIQHITLHKNLKF